MEGQKGMMRQVVYMKEDWKRQKGVQGIVKGKEEKKEVEEGWGGGVYEKMG